MSTELIKNFVERVFADYNHLSKFEVKFNPIVAARGHCVTVSAGIVNSCLTLSSISYDGIVLKEFDGNFTLTKGSTMVQFRSTGPLPGRYALGHFLNVFDTLNVDFHQAHAAIQLMVGVINRHQEKFTNCEDLDKLFIDIGASATCERLREENRKLSEEVARLTACLNDIHATTSRAVAGVPGGTVDLKFVQALETQ